MSAKHRRYGTISPLLVRMIRVAIATPPQRNMNPHKHGKKLAVRQELRTGGRHIAWTKTSLQEGQILGIANVDMAIA